MKVRYIMHSHIISLEEVNSRIRQTELFLKSAEESILKSNDNLKNFFWKSP